MAKKRFWLQAKIQGNWKREWSRLVRSIQNYTIGICLNSLLQYLYLLYWLVFKSASFHNLKCGEAMIFTIWIQSTALIQLNSCLTVCHWANYLVCYPCPSPSSSVKWRNASCLFHGIWGFLEMVNINNL